MWVSLRKRKSAPDPGARDEGGRGQDPAGDGVAGILEPEVAAGHADEQPDPEQPDAEQPWRGGGQ